jgi:hypothetical protein
VDRHATEPSQLAVCDQLLDPNRIFLPKPSIEFRLRKERESIARQNLPIRRPLS